MEPGVTLDPDRVVPTLGLQQVEQGRDGEGGIRTEPPPRDRGPGVGQVARQHGAQHLLPAVGTVHVARPERAPLQIAELVEHEERVQAFRLKVAIPGRALLIAVDRALGTVHVERDDLRRLPVVHCVDPAAGKIREDGEVLGPRQHRGLEPAHGARGRCSALHRPAADKLAHYGIKPKAVGVVDVLVAGEPREERLAEHAREAMPAVLARARIGDEVCGEVGQAEGVIQFPVEQQASVGADRRAMERELHRAVEFEPQRPGLLFTLRVRCHHAAPSSLTHCHRKHITVPSWLEAQSNWEFRDNTERLHSAIGHRPPQEVEETFYEQMNTLEKAA